MFTYLNYARYGIAKLAGLTRLSKTVCQTRDKFLQYPQDMIDYYNSVAKIIYGSAEVTDVTSVGDKNGFRAQSTAKVGEIFKGLANYEVPLEMRRTGITSRPILTGLNIYLNGYIEDQYRMKIETCRVTSCFGEFLFTIGYIPEISYVVFVQAIKVGPSAVLNPIYSLNNVGEVRGIGKFSQGFIVMQNESPMTIVCRVLSFSGSARMTTARNTAEGKFLVSPIFTLTAQQAAFLYFQTVCHDLDEMTLVYEVSGADQKADSEIEKTWNDSSVNSTNFLQQAAYDPSSPNLHNIWGISSYIPACYEIAVNDATAIALMYILSQDIMAEINAA